MECSCSEKSIKKVFRETIRTSLSKLKSKQSTNSLKFDFFGKNNIGTSKIIQNFVMKDRLNVLVKA